MFQKKYEDTPAFENFPRSTETLQVNYEEGIYIGYRYYDKMPETIPVPFVYGLSYSTFEISDLGMESKCKISQLDILIGPQKRAHATPR